MSDDPFSSGPISSDILEDQFGPTRLEILSQHDGTRIISTRARDGHVLELSLVTFGGPGGRRFPETHRQVLAGKSMGKAFRDDGLGFERKTLGTYKCVPPAAISLRFGHPGKVTVVDVSVMVGPRKLPYASILEVYSPDVVWPETSPADGGRIASSLRRFNELLTDIPK